MAELELADEVENTLGGDVDILACNGFECDVVDVDGYDPSLGSCTRTETWHRPSPLVTLLTTALNILEKGPQTQSTVLLYNKH